FGGGSGRSGPPARRVGRHRGGITDREAAARSRAHSENASLAVRGAPRANGSARPHREARRVRGFFNPRRDGDVPRAAGQTRKYRGGAGPARSHVAGRGAGGATRGGATPGNPAGSL